MKKIVVGILALIMGILEAHAAFEVTLDELQANEMATATFTYSNLDTVPTFDGGALSNATAVTESFISGASGSLSVTWAATDVAGPIDPSTWTFGTNANLFSFGNGLGIQSGVNNTNTLQTGGWAQFQAGEAFLLTFNTNNLVLAPGKVLIFSARAADNKAFNIYQRSGSTNGTLVATLAAATPADFSPFVQVAPVAQENGLLEFAITDFSAYGRMVDFKIDVIDEIVGTLPPTGLKVISRDAGALLKWDVDPTGTLDFYTVYRSSFSPVTASDWSTNVTDSMFTDSGLLNGGIYYYAITATGTNGVESEFSDEVSVAPASLSTNTVLLMDYDASDVASVQADLSGAVTNWLNQVGGDTYYPASSTSYSSPLYPSADLSDSGIAGLDCTTDPTQLQLMNAAQSDVLFDMSGTNSGFVVMMAIRPATLKENLNSQYIIANSSGPAGGGFGIRQKNNGIETWLGSSAGTMNSTPATGATVVVSVRYDVKDLELTAWESASGNRLTAPRDPEDYSTTLWLNLGDFTHSDFDFEGQIFEVKIWGSTLDDATLEAEQTAMVTKWVGLAGYDLWAKDWMVDIGENTNDFDADGLNNLYEYGLNGNPTNGARSPASLPALTKTDSGFEYIHPARSDDDTLAYTVQTTTNLVSGVWTNAGYTVNGTNVTGGTLNSVTNAVDAVENEKFIRLLIEQN